MKYREEGKDRMFSPCSPVHFILFKKFFLMKSKKLATRTNVMYLPHTIA